MLDGKAGAATQGVSIGPADEGKGDEQEPGDEKGTGQEARDQQRPSHRAGVGFGRSHVTQAIQQSIDSTIRATGQVK